jgi:hypothetical protein
MAAISKSSCRYQNCYCEENSILLCEQLVSDNGWDPDQLFVVFISNPLKQVPIWYQGASRTEDGLVIWDYHVSTDVDRVTVYTHACTAAALGTSVRVVFFALIDLIPLPTCACCHAYVGAGHPSSNRNYRMLHGVGPGYPAALPLSTGHLHAVGPGGPVEARVSEVGGGTHCRRHKLG